MRNQNVIKLTMAGLLIAIGVIIPMFSPLRIIIEPASYTLASHVVIFIAMFISTSMAALVVFGTTLGFFLGGFPIVVVLRAASHIIFATLGSFYLHKVSKKPLSTIQLRIFSFCIAIIHAASEVVVVGLFYFGGHLGAAFYEQTFLMSVLLLVGFGSVIHSMVDFEIARIVILPLKKQPALAQLFKTSSGRLPSSPV
ncbi:MAG: hypothetical protein FWD00_01260 [Clostridiales bacterium]|nr:hypothetical protein [Clostridiales bacterium]